MDQRKPLFCEGDAHAVEQQQRARLQEEIAHYDSNRLLNTNVEDLVQYFAEKYRIDVPRLREDQMSADHQEVQRDVFG
jgi:hypothetical protein